MFLGIVALGLMVTLVVTVVDLYDKLPSVSNRGRGMAVGAVVAASASALAAARLFWKLGRPERAPTVQAPEDIVRAAEVQAEKAEGVIAQVQDEAAKVRLQERARRAPGRPPAAAVPRRRLRHRVGGQDLADQRPARPGTSARPRP